MDYCVNEVSFDEMFQDLQQRQIVRADAYMIEADTHLLQIYYADGHSTGVWTDKCPESANRYFAIQGSQLWIWRWDETEEKNRLKLRRKFLKNAFVCTGINLSILLLTNAIFGFSPHKFLINLGFVVLGFAIVEGQGLWNTRKK